MGAGVSPDARRNVVRARKGGDSTSLGHRDLRCRGPGPGGLRQHTLRTLRRLVARMHCLHGTGLSWAHCQSTIGEGYIVCPQCALVK